MKFRSFLALGAFVILFGACGAPAPASPAALSSSYTPVPGATAPAPPGGSMQLTSSAFSQGGNIPQKYTCNGQSMSPPLAWSGPPANTQSYALIVNDPDAPSGNFVHWVAYDIPAGQTKIAEGANAAGRSGKNGSGRLGYTGPCPPSGTHRYIFTLYALDVPSLGLNEGATAAELEAALKNHILAQAQLTGKYGK